MSKQAFKRVRRSLNMEVNRTPLDSYAWPGGYQMYYLCKDGETMCPDCVNKEIDLIAAALGSTGYNRELRKYDTQWRVVAAEINYEDNDMHCCHCNEKIPAAYGDDEEKPEEPEKAGDEYITKCTLKNREYCPSDEMGYHGRCLGACFECGVHQLSTGRYTVYCPSCQCCDECGCPDVEGFSHYVGCKLAVEPDVLENP